MVPIATLRNANGIGVIHQESLPTTTTVYAKLSALTARCQIQSIKLATIAVKTVQFVWV
jgi:hypothetical protein